MRIPVDANDFGSQWRETAADVLAAISKVGASGRLILGEEVAAFEKDLSGYWGIPHAVGVASGLDALELGLRALGCRAGDRVLTTAVSAFATTLAVVKLGAEPVYADCEDNGLIDLGDCRRILHENPEIRFFVPVHLYGDALNIAELARLRDDFELRIVEDCAQSIGATSDGRPTGSAGQIAATSFYPTKNLGALGDGGAALTSDREYVERLRILRDYGQTGKFRHEIVGYNSRLDELHAAILRRAHLPRLDRWTERRREIARSYREGIANRAIGIPSPPPGSHSCSHLFAVTVAPEHKAAALDYFRAQGIAAGEHYPETIPEQVAMNTVRWRGDTPRARRFCRSQLSLPIHPYLSDGQIAWVIDAANAWRP